MRDAVLAVGSVEKRQIFAAHRGLGRDALPALEEICAQLRHGAHTDAQAVRDEVLKTVACKAAIKAGWQTEPEELLRLADAVCGNL